MYAWETQGDYIDTPLDPAHEHTLTYHPRLGCSVFFLDIEYICLVENPGALLGVTLGIPPRGHI